MISVYVHENGATRCENRVEPGWLDPSSRATFWVDLAAPAPEESRQVLADVFNLHLGIMVALAGGMLAVFRRRGWI